MDERSERSAVSMRYGCGLGLLGDDQERKASTDVLDIYGFVWVKGVEICQVASGSQHFDILPCVESSYLDLRMGDYLGRRRCITNVAGHRSEVWVFIGIISLSAGHCIGRTARVRISLLRIVGGVYGSQYLVVGVIDKFLASLLFDPIVQS